MDENNSYFSDAYFSDENMWYFDNAYQMLCKKNLDNGIVEEMIPYVEKEPFRGSSIFFFDRCLYITSFASTDVLKYSFEKKVLEIKKNSQEKIIQEAPFYNFYDYQMMVDNKIWFFPNYMIKPIYVYDLKRDTFEIDNMLSDYVLRYVKKEDKAICFSNGYQENFWMTIYDTNIFLNYNLKQKEIQEYRVNDSNVKLEAICFDGENVWMTQLNKNTMLKMKISDGSIEELDVLGMKEERAYARIESVQNYIVVLPCVGNKMVIVNNKGNLIYRLDLAREGFESNKFREGWAKIRSILEYKDKIICPAWGLSKSFEVKMGTWEVVKIDDGYVDTELGERLYYRTMLHKGYVYESKNEELEILIKYMYNLEEDNKDKTIVIGRNIYTGLI